MTNLTSKELDAIVDECNLEQTLVKKYEAMANLCSDAKIQQDLFSYANKHRAHYNTLIRFLQ